MTLAASVDEFIRHVGEEDIKKRRERIGLIIILILRSWLKSCEPVENIGLKLEPKNNLNRAPPLDHYLPTSWRIKCVTYLYYKNYVPLDA